MIWIVGIALALVSFKLGMLTILVKLMALALQMVLLALIGLGMYFLWRRYISRGVSASQRATLARIRENIDH